MYWGYLCMFSGVVTIIANLFFIFISDSFSHITWMDRHGKFQTIHLDPEFLFLLAVGKIVAGGYLSYKQGTHTLTVFKTIVKEYYDAE